MTQDLTPCSRCGTNNLRGQRYCGGCNERLHYNCPSCNEEVDNVLHNCPKCKVALAWPTPGLVNPRALKSGRPPPVAPTHFARGIPASLVDRVVPSATGEQGPAVSPPRITRGIPARPMERVIARAAGEQGSAATAPAASRRVDKGRALLMIAVLGALAILLIVGLAVLVMAAVGGMG